MKNKILLRTTSLYIKSKKSHFHFSLSNTFTYRIGINHRMKISFLLLMLQVVFKSRIYVHGINRECGFVISTSVNYKIGQPDIFNDYYYIAYTRNYSNIENKLITGVSGEAVATTGITSDTTVHRMNAANAHRFVLSGNLDYVPTNLKSFFKSFISLSITLPRLTTIDPEVFINIPDLEELEIYESSLFYLPGTLLQNNKKLIILSIRGNGDPYNSLEYIGRDLLTYSSQLKWVGIRNHTCIDEEATNSKQIANLRSFLQVVCPVCRAKSCSDVFSESQTCYDSCF